MKHLIVTSSLLITSNLFAANPLIGNWISNKKTIDNTYSRLKTRPNIKAMKVCFSSASSDPSNDNFMLIGKSAIQFLQIQNPNSASVCKVDHGTIPYSYSLKDKWILLEGEATPFTIKSITANELVLEE
jgi:hypothetical protein